jgi:hypothetical protein
MSFQPFEKRIENPCVFLAAEHAFVRRRHLLGEDVGIEAPAARIIEVRVAVLEARERRPLRLVDLGQVRPARKHHYLGRAGFERLSGVVER